MARRFAWWTGLGILAVVLLSLGAWRLSHEIPSLIAGAGEQIREEAARMGLGVSFRGLKFHLLTLSVSLEKLEVRDDLAGLPLGAAEGVDVTLSPHRLLSGQSPVSRIRARNFTFRLEEGNRVLVEKLRAGKSERNFPEILLIDGDARIGPYGPVKRWEASVQEVRIRDLGAFGIRVNAEVENASGEVVLPGVGEGNWPFRALEADFQYNAGVIRLKKLRAAGPPASMRASGVVDTRKGSFDLKVGGEADIGKWLETGAPGERRLRNLVRTGEIQVSASLGGTFEDPAGSGKLILKDGRFPGGNAADVECSLDISDRRIKAELQRGNLWGGSLSGSGYFDLRAGKGEGKLSLAKAAFANVPWKQWGLSWRPSGHGDLDLALSGAPSRFEGSLEVKIPDGWESTEGQGSRETVRLPTAAAIKGSVTSGQDIGLTQVVIRAGGGELSGTGSVSLSDGKMRLSGNLKLAGGRASEYGSSYPLAWERLGGEWEIEGRWARPGVSVRLEAEGLAIRAMPPLSAVIKAQGFPSEMVHFVADVPTDAGWLTATGTVAGLYPAGKPRLEASLTVREIDFSEAGRWGRAVLESLGQKSFRAEALDGLTGEEGSADIQVSLSRDGGSVSGKFYSQEIAWKGVKVGSVKVDGEWSRAGGADHWTVKGDGRLGEGTIRFSGSGKDDLAEIHGVAERIELGRVVAALGGGKGDALKGIANADVAVRRNASGWEVPRCAASATELSVGRASFRDVKAEGSLEAASGKVELSSASPAVRVSAETRREGGWPVTFSAVAREVPTGFILAAAGRPDVAAGGVWQADAGGRLSSGADIWERKISPVEALTALRFSASASSPSVAGASSGDWRVSGGKEGNAIAGEIWTRYPDTHLSYSITLRDPYSFRIDGPFVFGMTGNGTAREEGKARFTLAGDAEIAGALRALENTSGTLRIKDLFIRSGGLDVSGKDLSARMEATGVRWTGGTVSVAGNAVNVSGKVSWGGDLDVKLDGKVPAAAVRLATDVFDRLDGTIRMELRLKGKWNDPTVVGTGRLDGGVFSFKGYGQLFEQMSAEAVISREKIVFERFDGKSGGGYLDGWGELPLQFDKGQRMFFSVDFLDMRYPYPDELRPVVQGHVDLFGPIDDLLATGDVEVQSALYSKPIGPEKTLIDFRRRLADVTARKEKTDFRVRLDIDGIADGTIRIKNNLADAYAKGEFKVAGDSGRVIILGSFDVLEGGTLDYRGNRYDIKRVTVDFQDPRRNNPRLDARAETKKGNVTAIVSVTGTLEKYEVDVSSDPPMSKNDVVSLLSLGVTTSALAGAEGSLGAGAAASVALGPYKGGVEEGIRGIIGLDRFTIEPSFSAAAKSFEPKFIVGKSFGERFSVSVSTNVGTTAESSASAEFKILENVYLQGGWESATTTREGDLGADLKIRFRYREFKDFLRGNE